MEVSNIFPISWPMSRLGYGTTSLMAVQGSEERLALLECAYDSGILHFDTAPYYGYGEAERVMGKFLRGKRARPHHLYRGVWGCLSYGMAV